MNSVHRLIPVFGKMLFLFLLIVPNLASQDVENLSSAVDMGLRDLNSYIQEYGLEYFKLPDMNRFPFYCKDGRIGNASTIYRKDPIYTSRKGNQVMFYGKLALHVFDIYYKNCLILHFIPQDIEISLENIHFPFVATVEKKGNECLLNIRNLTIEFNHTPEFHTNVNRWLASILAKVETYTVDFFLKAFKTSIIDYVNKNIKKISKMKIFSC